MREIQNRTAIKTALCTLHDVNKRAMTVDGFKTFVSTRQTVLPVLEPVHEALMLRRLRFMVYRRRQKSESMLVNRMKDAFGSNAVIAFGDWSERTQKKYSMPSKSVGMRKLLSRNFDLVLVNEFRTSKLCNRCSSELVNHRFEDERPKHRLLTCSGRCGAIRERGIAFITRDLNSAINIRNMAVEWILHRSRPLPFCRTVA